MPRFSIKSLLIFTAVIALWLSTFAIEEFTLSRDIRGSILLIIYLAVASAAVFHRGKTRVFWVGFLVVLLFMLLIRWLPEGSFGWGMLKFLWAHYDLNDPRSEAVYWSVWTCWTLALAMIGGSVTAYIYDQSQQDKDG